MEIWNFTIDFKCENCETIWSMKSRNTQIMEIDIDYLENIIKQSKDKWAKTIDIYFKK